VEFRNKRINGALDEIKSSLRNHYNDLKLKETIVTAENVENAFLGIGQVKYLLIELFEECNSILKKQVGISKYKATDQKAEVCKRHISNN